MRNKILAMILLATSAVLLLGASVACAVVVQYYDGWTGENQVTLRIDAVGFGDLLAGGGLYTTGRGMTAQGEYDLSVTVVSATRPVWFRFCSQASDPGIGLYLHCLGTSSTTGPAGPGAFFSRRLKYTYPSTLAQLAQHIALLELSFEGLPSVADIQSYVQVNSQTPGPLPEELPLLAAIEEVLDQLGGDEDNEGTDFDAGVFEEEGAGMCAPQGLPTYQVNMSNLLPVIKDSDLNWTSYGHDMTLGRTWNLRPDITGMFGRGWTFAYESSIRAGNLSSSSRANLHMGSGQVVSYSAGIVTGFGSGALVAQYSRAAPGLGPDMTGYVAEYGGAGYYLLHDIFTRMTRRYEYARTDEQTGEHIYTLRSITDRNENAVSLEYGANGRLAKLKDASGREVAFSYNEQGLCTSMATFTGSAASFQYDAAGNLIRSQDLAGNVVVYAYNAANHLTTMTAAGKTTQFGYELLGDRPYVATLTNANGVVRRFSAQRTGASGTQSAGDAKANSTVSKRMTTVTQPGGGVRTFVIDSGKTTALTDEIGRTTTLTYNAFDLPVRITDVLGFTRDFAYNNEGRLVTVTNQNGKITSGFYDIGGNLTRIANSLGQTWTYEYDARHNLTASVSPVGLRTAFTRNDKGLVTTLTLPATAPAGDAGGDAGGDALPGAVAFLYDSHGNPTRQTGPDGGVEMAAYDANGLNRVSQTTPRGHTTSFAYDANRRLVAVARPDGSLLGYSYDCCGLSSQTDGAGKVTRFARDAMLNVTSITDPLGGVTSMSYNADGDMVARTNPLGQGLNIVLDAAHQPAEVANPLGARIVVARDAAGKPVGVTDEQGRTTTLQYDNTGQLAAVTDPLGATVLAVTRDDAGRMVSTVNARGMEVGYERDAGGRIVEKQYDGAVVASYAYGPDGRLASYTDASGTTVLGRDIVGRVTGITYPGGEVLALSYDLAGNVASMTYPDGLVVQYAYDTLNRPAQVSFAGNVIQFAYDGAGRLVRETRSNSVESVYTYNAAGRLTGLRHAGNTGVIADIVSHRDAAGQVTAETGTWPILPELATASSVATFNPSNALTNFDNAACSSDADGNLTGMAGARNFAAVYDAENRPVTLSASGTTSHYVYGALGNRVQATTGSQVRRYRHDQFGRLVRQTGTAGAATTNYIHAGGRLVASGTAAAGFVWHHADKTGNALALTDAAGTVVGAYAYTVHGAVAARSGIAETPFTYVGAYGVMDEGNGIFFMTNRYYDAQTGRFLQRDPIGFSGGLNLYGYAGNNPVSRIDPSGLREDEDYFNDIRPKTEWTFDDEATDMTLSSSPTAVGPIYTGLKSIYLSSEGEEGATSRADKFLLVGWELGKALFAVPGLFAEFMTAGCDRQRLGTARDVDKLWEKYGGPPSRGKSGARERFCFPRTD